ncbi:MAG: peroxiredoxin [Acidobacteriota bacterium]|nr:peroxiredoxin [Acidobacteriota bacterium]
MMLQLGDPAPDFEAETTAGPIRFHAWLGDAWGVLFSHPRDFTPVCATELGAVARLKGEFTVRNVRVIGLSLDSLAAHEAWARDIAETQGTALNFPLIADPERAVATLYGMIHPNADDTATVRAVFVIDPGKRIQLILSYPETTGRNFHEILRAVDALQLTACHRVGTPANWRHGEDVIILPALSDEEAAVRFPAGWRAPRPYLRITPQPRDRH